MSLPSKLRSCALARLAPGALILALIAVPWSAQAAVPGPGTIGSPDVATADPAVPRPAGAPCVVTLLPDTTFTDFATRPFDYTPPAGCGNGRWSKVVLEADFSVTAGRQFDRTASLWLGGVNLYFGTTQEPSATVAPSWHVERDLTDYSALLRQSGQGQAIIGNIVNDTYTGIIHGRARLLFYPAQGLTVAVAVPDAVYPLGSDPVGGTVSLNGPADTLARTLTLPRNITRAYLDVFTQSQGGDEFWYTCVPDAYAEQVQECGGGNFREAEVSIDGVAAGAAPVLPWIYTGGIDPYLWRPTPGVQTLNFMPYRVDLSPFAGQLSDGAPHTVAVGVAGAHNYFSAAATLLVYRDAHRAQVSGKVTANTLAGQAVDPVVASTVSTDADGNLAGDITTRIKRQYAIDGYVDTSRGRLRTKVTGSIGFDNTQSFISNDSRYRQLTTQATEAQTVSDSHLGLLPIGSYSEQVRYPLTLDYDQQVGANVSTTVTTRVSQGVARQTRHRLLGLTLYSTDLSNQVDTADSLVYGANGSLRAHDGQHSRQAFSFGDSLGACYRASVTTDKGVLSASDAGNGCPGGRNRVPWFVHPDGSPDSLSQAPLL